MLGGACLLKRMVLGNEAGRGLPSGEVFSDLEGSTCDEARRNKDLGSHSRASCIQAATTRQL
jgi:hypothetical protein